MKGISAVIGALIVLIITIALGGLAYTFITGTATRQIAVVLGIDSSTTGCSGTSITVGLTNDGTSPISLSALTITGTNSTGQPLTTPAAGVSCATTGQLTAGGRATCTALASPPNFGTKGNNVVTVTGGGSSAQGVVTCI